jgi:hypothetical protein
VAGRARPRLIRRHGNLLAIAGAIDLPLVVWLVLLWLCGVH